MSRGNCYRNPRGNSNVIFKCKYLVNCTHPGSLVIVSTEVEGFKFTCGFTHVWIHSRRNPGKPLEIPRGNLRRFPR